MGALPARVADGAAVLSGARGAGWRDAGCGSVGADCCRGGKEELRANSWLRPPRWGGGALERRFARASALPAPLEGGGILPRPAVGVEGARGLPAAPVGATGVGAIGVVGVVGAAGRFASASGATSGSVRFFSHSLSTESQSTSLNPWNFFLSSDLAIVISRRHL